MPQIVGEIRKVEEESEQLIKESRENARRIIEEAKAKGKKLSAEAEQEAKKEVASLREKAEAEAGAEAKLIEKNTVRERENLKVTAGKNFDEAVSFIVRRMFG